MTRDNEPAATGQQRTAEEASLVRTLERLEGRKLTQQEQNTSPSIKATSPAPTGYMLIYCAGWRTKSGGTPDKWWGNCRGNSLS